MGIQMAKRMAEQTNQNCRMSEWINGWTNKLTNNLRNEWINYQINGHSFGAPTKDIYVDVTANILQGLYNRFELMLSIPGYK